MKNTILRDKSGRVMGKLDPVFFSQDDIHWRDQKVKPDEMLFPQHSGTMHSDVRVYHISELNKN